ncbi:MAG: pilus assembly PilX N-terminal domain-containing protein [Magnetococcales bacterium]|nr:pilus assembly PilX N-terminal domain-containing protein [Magnetococcales bacterium]
MKTMHAHNRTDPLASSASRHEAGAALVVGLSILMALTVLGTASLNTTSLDIRSAGNTRSAKQAFYLAEAGIAHGADIMQNNTASWDSLSTLSSLIDGTTTVGSTGNYQLTITSEPGSMRKLTSVGTTGSGGEAMIESTFRWSPSMKYPWEDALVGCDGVTINGNGETDSYNSDEGDYDPDNPGYEGDVSTVNAGSFAAFNGNDVIRGDINVIGDMDFGTNAESYGNVNLGGTLTLGNNAQIHDYDNNTVHVGGNIDNASNNGIGDNASDTVPTFVSGDVNLGNNARIYGELHAGGDLNFNHNNARQVGDAYVDGSVSHESKVIGDVYAGATAPTNIPSVTPCDPLDVASLVNSNRPTVGPVADEEIDDDDQTWNTVGPHAFNNLDIKGNTTVNWDLSSVDEMTVYVGGDFNLQGNGEINVTGSGTVTLFVEGEMSTSGNGAINLNVNADDNVTLLIYTLGRVSIGGNGVVNNSTPTQCQIYTSFASTSDDPGSMTHMHGNASFNGALYAPLSTVHSNGNAATFGAIRGREITMTGNANFHYDEALGKIGVDDGSGTVSKVTWREVR